MTPGLGSESGHSNKPFISFHQCSLYKENKEGFCDYIYKCHSGVIATMFKFFFSYNHMKYHTILKIKGGFHSDDIEEPFFAPQRTYQ